MIYNYFFEEKAQEEYEDALFWYLTASEKVADNFVSAIDNTLQLICEHPKRWRNEYKDYFELSLKKFPYKIIYWINEEKKINSYIIGLSSKSKSFGQIPTQK